MNWADVGVPNHVIVLKTAWDRRHRVLRAILAGAKQNGIARHLGISNTAIRGMYLRAMRDVRENRPDPIEAWLDKEEQQAILDRRDLRRYGLRMNYNGTPLPTRDWLII